MGGNENKKSLSYYLLSKEDKLKQAVTQDEIIDLVDNLLYRAIIRNASDIHLQPDGTNLRIRYRIDGLLYDQDPILFEQMLAALSRIKVLASMDIAEKRLPQDGKIQVLVEKNSNAIDLRIATFPSSDGEKMVIRLLDRSKNLLNVSTLGLSSHNSDLLHKALHSQQGFFLVTGPTGSGKTTTLYALLSQLNKPSCNIITMEDPIEYDLAGITQSQVNEKMGFTFENGLRSIVRQDPDVIMIGEMRDRETVQMAIRSALTGHLVLSTLHTNDAVGALSRLIDMGVEPFLLNATLTGVLAQRLARRLCDACKIEVDLAAEEQELLQGLKLNLKKVFKAKGCSQCFSLGYKGRVGIFELFLLNAQSRELLNNNASIEQIRAQAAQSGMHELVIDAFEKLKRGVISFEDFRIFVYLKL